MIVDRLAWAMFYGFMHRERSEYLRHLQEVIFKLHGCNSEYLSTVNVVDVSDGETLWAGEVEVFALEGCEKAKICYGWSYKYRKDGMDCENIHATLQISPITDAKSAVQAGIDAEALARRAKLEMEVAWTKPWTAKRMGTDIYIKGFRPFLIKDPKWRMCRDMGKIPGDTIAYLFSYELPDDFPFPQQIFYRVDHVESGVPSEVVQVKITDETGKSYFVPVE